VDINDSPDAAPVDEEETTVYVKPGEGPLYSRVEPFTFDEQRAIDQKGFLWPDYCVCRRPDIFQEAAVCRRQAELVKDPTLQTHYPIDSEQIQWVVT